ncbi:restriction endonuclease subunit S [Faecalibacterium prausnitzii]|nr:restriction endonuclease subunit S [Faecalibacterium prausnitzii]
MTGQQLKNSILQMAVQGKLVPQDPNDEPASVLLERIRAEKEQLIKEGKIKKEKNPSVIFRGADNLPYEKVGKNEPVCIADEVPFDIPESWEWVRLEAICTKLVDGDHNPPKGCSYETAYVMVSSTNINDDCIVELEKVRYLEKNIFDKENERTNAATGDIFFTSVGSLGRSCVYEGGLNICFQRSVSVIHTLIFNYYLKYCLDSAYIQQKIVREATGTAQKGFYLNQLALLLIPIPPIKEQHRIVSKYLETVQMQKEYYKTNETLDVLNSRFPATLKKSILQYAVQGKLVPQNPADEPASVLLERIRTEKEQLVKEGKIKRDKHESVIFRRDNSYYEKVDGIERCIDDELPFEIPESWEWVHFFSVVEIATNLVSPERYFDYMHIAPDNIEKLTGTLLDCRTVAQDKVSSPNHLFFKGQILYSKIRPLLRKAVIAPFDGLCSADMYPLKTPINKEYLLRYILSDSFNAQVATAMSSRVKMPKINQAELSKVLIPVPPIQEQNRIANKIKELYMALV